MRPFFEVYTFLTQNVPIGNCTWHTFQSYDFIGRTENIISFIYSKKIILFVVLSETSRNHISSKLYIKFNFLREHFDLEKSGILRNGVKSKLYE